MESILDKLRKTSSVNTSIDKDSSTNNENDSSDFLNKIRTGSDFNIPFSTLDRTFVGDITEFDENRGNSFIPEGGFEALRKQRAINQSTGEQIGNTLKPLIPRVALGIVENAGRLIDAPSSIFGEKKDFSNGITEWAEKSRQSGMFGEENFPVYRENPDEVFDMTDNAWWTQHAGGLLESIGEFYVTGFGVAKGLGSVGKQLTALNKTIFNPNITSGAANVLTSASLSYTESAMAGSNVYKDTYDRAINELNLTPEKANKLASGAAAHATKIGTLLGTALNMTSTGALFSKQLGTNSYKILKGESREAYNNRLTGLLTEASNPLKKQNFVGKLALEGLQEGGEEVGQLFAEGEGRLEGGLTTKKEVGETWFDRLVNTSLSEEGGLNFLLGAFGGVLQTGAVHATTNKSNTEAEENIRQSKISRLELIRGTIKDIEGTQNELRAELNQEPSEIDYDRVDVLKNKLFSHGLSKHIIDDTEDALIGTMRDISKVDNTIDLGQVSQKKVDELTQELNQKKQTLDQVIQQEPDNLELQDQLKNDISTLEDAVKQESSLTASLWGKTEAIQQGLTQNKFDSSYKDVALSKIEDIQRYKKEYDDLQSKYNVSDNTKLVNIAGKILSNNVKSDNDKKTLDKTLDKGVENKNKNSYYLNDKYPDLDLFTNDSLLLEGKIEALNAVKTLTETLPYFTEDKGKQSRVSKRIKLELKKYNEELTKLKKEQVDSKNLLKDKISTEISSDDAINIKDTYSKNYIDEFILKNNINEYAIDNEELIKNPQVAINKFKNIVKQYDSKDDKSKDNGVVKTRQTNIQSEPVIVEPTINDDEGVISNTIINDFDQFPDIDVNDPTDRFKKLINNAVSNKELDSILDQMDKHGITSPELLNYLSTKRDIFNETTSKTVQTNKDQSGSENDNSILPREENFIPENIATSYSETSNFSKNPSDGIELDLPSTSIGKIIEAASSIAVLFKEYDVVKNGLRTNTNELNQNLSKILLTDKLKKGDKLKVEVDTKNESYEEFKNDPMMIPLKITHINSGEKLGYIHTIEYLNETRVVEFLPDSKGELTIPNLENQKKQLTSLRNHIFEKGSFDTTIEKVNGGRALSMNRVGEKLRPSNEVFKNKDLKFAIVDNGIRLPNQKIDVLNNDEWLQDPKNAGKVVALLPLRTGELIAAPISVSKLSNDKIDTIMNAIEIYANNNSEVSIELANTVGGSSITTPVGLSKFMERYVMTRTLNEPVKGKDGKIITDSTKLYIGTVTKDSTLLNGIKVAIGDLAFQEGEYFYNFSKEELKKPENLKFIRTHLEKRYTNMDGKLMNQKFTPVHITKKDGRYSLNIGKRSEYNDYIKENTKTDLHENVVPYKGETYYSYVDNPTTEIGIEVGIKNISEIIEGNENVEVKSLFVDDFMSAVMNQYSKNDTIQVSDFDDTDEISHSPLTSDDKTKLEILKEQLLSEVDKDFTWDQFNDVIESGVSRGLYIQRKGFTREESINAWNDYINKGATTEHANQQAFIKVQKHLSYINKTIQKQLDNLDTSLFETLESDGAFNDSENDEGLDDISQSEKVFQNSDMMWREDNKFKASKKMKSFLFTVLDLQKVTTNTGVRFLPKLNYLNDAKIVPIDKVFNKLKVLLANSSKSFNDMMEIISREKDNIHWLRDIQDKFTDSSYAESMGFKNLDQLKRQFVKLMSNSNANFKTALYETVTKNDAGGEYDEIQLSLIDSNRFSQVKVLTEGWRNNIKFQKDGLFRTLKNEKVLNKTKLQSLIKSFEDKVLNDPTYEPTVEYAMEFLKDGFNISISIETINQIKKDNGNKLRSLFANNNQLFNIFYKRLKSIENSTTIDFTSNNPLNNNSSVEKLAFIESKYSSTLSIDSMKNVEGQLVNTINQKRHITDRLQEVKNPTFAKTLLKVPFLKPSELYDSVLTRLANNDGSLIKNLQLNLFDGLNNKNSDSKGKKLSGQDARELELSKIIAFNDSYYIQGADKYFNYVNFVSGKSTTFMLRLPREEVIIDDSVPNVSKLADISVDKLYAVVESEINRMNTFQESSDVNIEGYIPNKFYFFQDLNKPVIIKDENGNNQEIKIIVNNRVDVDNTVRTAIRTQIRRGFNAAVNEKVKTWTDLGLLEKGVSFLPYGYKNDPTGFAVDYVFNNMLGKFNFHQLIAGDPALFGKEDEDGTWDNITKRGTKDQSPGTDTAYDVEFEQYTQIALADLKLNSQNIENLSEGFKGINVTDAQEYGTVKSALVELFTEGTINREQYDRFLTNYRKNGIVPQIAGIFNPRKQAYSGKKLIKDKNDVVIAEGHDFIKSSVVFLNPDIIAEGSGLDKIRKLAEALEVDENGKEITTVRLSHKSANKLGVAKPLQIYDSKGNVLDDIKVLPENYTQLERKNLRNQQDLPYDSSKDKTIDGTQQRKLITYLLNVIESNFSYNDLSGKDLLKEYNKLYENKFNEAFKQLEAELLDENGEVDLNKLSSILIEEGDSKNWSEAALKQLEIKNGKFRFPLYFSSNSNKIESLLLSIINNRVLNQKRQGKSLVLMSEAGITGYARDIVYTDKYNPLIGLQPMKFVDGKIQAGQIIMPSLLKGVDGKIIDVKKYATKNEQGALILDSSKIPSELLEVFGYRIPTQGYNSMAHLEIVGFLPTNMGDTVIASRDLIAQMGSDFDVDKLYIFTPEYKENIDILGLINRFTESIGKLIQLDGISKYNNLSPSKKFKLLRESVKNNLPLSSTEQGIFNDWTSFKEKQLSNFSLNTFSKVKSPNNKSLDIERSILSNKDMFDFIAESLTTGFLGDISSKIKTNRSLPYVSDHYMTSKYLEAQDGATGIGVFATNGTLISLASNLDEGVEVYHMKNGNKQPVGFAEKRGNNISDVKTIDGKHTKLQINSYFLSASVDNENDPILGKLNMNKVTFPAITTMINAGFKTEIVDFINQDVIRAYVKNYSDLLSKSNDEFIYDIEGQALRLTTEQLGLKFSTNEARFDEINSKSKIAQYEHLVKFRELTKLGRELSKVKRIINMDSKNLPKSIMEVFGKHEDVKLLHNEVAINSIKNADKLLGEYNIDHELINPSNISGFTTFNALKAFDKLYADQYSEMNSGIFEETKIQIAKIIGKYSLSFDHQSEIFRNLKSFKMSGLIKSIISDTLFNERKRLLYGDNHIGVRLLEVQNKYPNNLFIQAISVTKDDNIEAPVRLYYDNISISHLDPNIIQSSFNSLLLNDDANEFMEDLIRTSLITDYNNKTGNLVNLIPIEWFEVNNMIEPLQANWNDNTSSDQFVEQLIRNVPKFARKIPKEFRPKNRNESIKLTEDNEEHFIYQEAGESRVSPYASFFDSKSSGYILYKYFGDSNEYKRISTLGYTKNLFEYDPTSIELESTYSKNNVNNLSTIIERNTYYPEQDKIEIDANDVKAFTSDYDTSSMKNMLESLSKRTENESLKQVFNLFSNYSNNVKIVIEKDVSFKGQYNSSKNTITMNGKLSKSQFEKEFTEEMVHSMLDHIVKNPKTVEEKELVAALKGIQTNLNNKLKQNSEKYKKFEDKYKKFKTLSIEEYAKDEDNLFTIEEAELYRSSLELNEFVANIFKSEYLQKALKTNEFTKDKTLIQRLIDVINKFISSFKTLDGTVIGKNTDLENSISNILQLLEVKSEIKSTKFNIKTDSRIGLRVPPSIEGLPASDILKLANIKHSKFNSIDGNDEKLVEKEGGGLALEYVGFTGGDILIEEANFLRDSSIALEFYKKYENDERSEGLSLYEYAKKIINDNSYTYDKNQLDLFSQSPRTLNDFNTSYSLKTKEKSESESRVTKLISKLESDIKRLKSRINSEKGNPSEVRKLNEQLERSENRIDEIVNSESLLVAIEKGNEEIDDIIKILDSSKINVDELARIGQQLKLWSNIDNELLTEKELSQIDTTTTKEANELKYRAERVFKKYLNLSKKYYADKKNMSIEDYFIPQPDIGTLKREALAANRTGGQVVINPDRTKTITGHLITEITKKLVDANTLAEQEELKWNKERGEEFNNVKKSSLYKSLGKDKYYDLFSQKDLLGKPTGRLVDRTSQTYYDNLSDERFKLNSVLKNPLATREMKKEANKKYNKFINDNTISIELDKVFDRKTFKLLDSKVVDEYAKELAKKLGGSEESSLIQAKEMIDAQKSKIDSYKEYLDDVIEETELSDLTENEKTLKIERFKSKYDPFKVLDDKNSVGVVLDGVFVYRSHKNVQYAPIAKWNDSNFEKINIDPEARKFYNYLKNTLNRLYRLAPDEIFEEIQHNHLPYFEKSFMDEVLKDGVLSASTGISDRLLDLIREKESSNIITSEQDRISGISDQDLRFPIQRKNYINEVAKKQGLEAQSFDLDKILSLATKQVLIYKHKKVIESEVRLGRELMNELSESSLVKGRLVTDDKGEIVLNRENSPLVNTLAQLDFTLMNKFWNVDTNKNKGEIKKVLTKKEKEIVESLIKEGRENEVSKVGKTITSNSIALRILDYARIKAMSLNVLSSINNTLIGNISNWIQAAGNEEFGFKEMKEANRIMLSSSINILPSSIVGGIIGTLIAPGIGTVIGAGLGSAITFNKSLTKEGKKINSLMKLFSPLGDITDENYLGVEGGTKLNSFSLMQLQKNSEYFVQGTTMIARMKKIKIKNKNGEEISLYDAYDENATLNPDEFSKEVINDWSFNNFTKNEGKEFLKFKRSLGKTLGFTHGDYGVTSALKANETILGKALFMFRRWIPEGVAGRAESLQYDEDLERYREGRWKNFDMVKTSLKRAIIQSGTLGLKSTDIDSFSDTEKANIKRNVMEIQIWGGLLLAGLLLKGLSDDDDEKYMTNLAINMILRSQADIEFYFNPTSFESITKNSIPAFSVISDGSKAFRYGTRVLFDDEATQKTTDAFVRQSFKMFPLGSNINTVAASERVFERN